MSTPLTRSNSVRQPKRRWPLAVAFAGLVLVILVSAVPWILGQLDTVESTLTKKMAVRSCDVSIDRADVGWFTPLTLRGLRIADQKGRWHLEVPRLEGSHHLWQMLVSRRDRGTFGVQQPKLYVTQPDQIRAALNDLRSGRPPQQRKVRFELIEGMILSAGDDADSSVIVQDLNVGVDWHQSADRRTLEIDAGDVFREAVLTREISDLAIKYVAPVMSNVTWTTGRFSLKLDACRIEIDQPDATDVAGQLTLNDVEAGLKESLAKDLTRLVATLTQRELPNAIALARESTVDFQIHDAQVSHQGLAFGLPDVSPVLLIQTEGTVGFDQHLDLVATLPLPLNRLGDGKWAQILGEQKIQVAIGGTLDEPVVEADSRIANDLVQRLLDPVTSGDIQAEDVIDAVRELRQRVRSRRDPAGNSEGPLQRLRDRLRSNDP